MKKFLFMALIASSLFACNKQDVVDTGEEMTGENTVFLSIKQAPSTRGVSDQKGDPEYSVIGSAKIFFIDASGTSIYQRELTTNEITALANTSTTEGGNTVVITGVPNTAKTLYFIANIKTAAGTNFPMVDGTTSADARLRIDKLQANATNVPMSGQSATFVPTALTNQYTASVTLTPIVARLELGQLTCQNQNGAGQPAVSADITGYKLSGVFINNVRENVLLDGTPYLVGSHIDIKNQLGWSTGWASYFTPANTSFPYYVGGTPAAPSDWVANSMVTYCNPTGGTALSFYPDLTNGSTSTDPGLTPKQAWGYQICPSTTVIGTATDVPHIILKLTEVTYNDNPLGLQTKYVTVTKYKDDLGNPIAEFKRGNVYRINNLVFSHNESTNQPYEKNITVTATVLVAPWVINTINPDWN